VCNGQEGWLRQQRSITLLKFPLSTDANIAISTRVGLLTSGGLACWSGRGLVRSLIQPAKLHCCSGRNTRMSNRCGYRYAIAHRRHLGGEGAGSLWTPKN